MPIIGQFINESYLIFRYLCTFFKHKTKVNKFEAANLYFAIAKIFLKRFVN